MDLVLVLLHFPFYIRHEEKARHNGGHSAGGKSSDYTDPFCDLLGGLGLQHDEHDKDEDTETKLDGHCDKGRFFWRLILDNQVEGSEIEH